MVNIQKFSLRIVKESGGRYDIDKYVRNPFQARDLFVEVVELDISECKILMKEFIQEYPELWNEDIGKSAPY